MSIYSSLYIGMSGMRANEGAIGVIGNNIANVNTVGYKSSRAVFADVLSQNVLGMSGPSQVGQGSGIATVQRMVEQGALLATNVKTDLAVGGDGYFMVDTPEGDRMFTRNGQFQVDSDGFLSTVDGYKLVGYPADGAGNVSGRLGNLEIGEVIAPPKATTEAAINMNLAPNAPADYLDGALDLTDAETIAASSHATTSITVYDATGAAHQLDVYFSQTDANEWTYTVVAQGDEIEGGLEGENTLVAEGTLSFDDGSIDIDLTGKLFAEVQNETQVTFRGAPTQELLFDFGEELENGGDGSGTSQWDGAQGNSSTAQNGFGVGELQFINFDTNGEISGRFDNGREMLLGQLSLARFEAPHELNSVGGNYFGETLSSGQPSVGEPGSGGRGEIFSGALEQSTVDLTNEFTQLITTQRGFQAAGRTITTADEMLIEIVNLKR